MSTGKKRPHPPASGGPPAESADPDTMMEFSPPQRTPAGTPPLDPPAAPGATEDFYELAADDLVMLDGSVATEEKGPGRSPTKGGASEMAGHRLEGEDGPELELDHSPPRPPPLPQPDDESQPLPAAQEAPADAPPPPGEVPSPRPRRSMSYPGQARAGKRPRVLFGGWFRKRARVRIAVGFAVALTLGSVIPLLHASSVMSSQVRPLLQELSNVQAHKHQLMGQPNYRSPDQLKAAISSVQSRNMPVTFVLWAAITAGLAYLWFRFV